MLSATARAAMAKIFRIVDHTIPGQHIREYARATANSRDERLMLAVKQYIPLDNPVPRRGDVTILAAHANGFPKEMYEALWEELHATSKAAGFNIRSIWIADAAWQGQSGVINETELGNDPSWIDYSRDLLQLTNHFGASMPRPIIGIGHSFGGAAMTNLAVMHPRLMHSLVLLDPVISVYPTDPPGSEIRPAWASFFRRDLWPSREEAERRFRNNRFYGTWDPRVLDAWCRYGLRETPTATHPHEPKGQVTLTTSKHQEMFTYLRPTWAACDSAGTAVLHPEKIPDAVQYGPDGQPTMAKTCFPFYRPESGIIQQKLPFVRPSVLYVFGAKSEMSTPTTITEKLEVTGVAVGGSGGKVRGMVHGVSVEGAGHLVPMEKPKVVAEHAATWIAKELARFQKEEEVEEQEWRHLQSQEKITMDKTWELHLGAKRSKI